MTGPTTYGDIEPVTRELINMTVAQSDPFGSVKLRHLDAMFHAIAGRPIAATQELVRADIEHAVYHFNNGDSSSDT
ncbi:hypothetical protein [Dactylosporangium sp. CA-233914]|uniref:hypothetical protein n=1 Tax=Dactylosporangium sp. CA-233914 TaxID=3239934 RepID=UPI003D937215